MEIVLVLLPFVVLGIAVLVAAFAGGPKTEGERHPVRGRRAFGIAMPLLYVGLGIAVPAAVILSRGEATGGTPELRERALADAQPPEGSEAAAGADLERGKALFRQTCAVCHTLAAVNAGGVMGPSLDELGALTPERVVSAIRNGGTGQDQMPASLLSGQDARDVAAYVATVAREP